MWLYEIIILYIKSDYMGTVAIYNIISYIQGDLKSKQNNRYLHLSNLGEIILPITIKKKSFFLLFKKL